MTTKEFIEKAIEGGWKPIYSNFTFVEHSEPWINGYLREKGIEKAILDPKAWEAVGKVEMWEHKKINGLIDWATHNKMPYSTKMHQMIDALIEGISIEGYLKTL